MENAIEIRHYISQTPLSSSRQSTYK